MPSVKLVCWHALAAVAIACVRFRFRLWFRFCSFSISINEVTKHIQVYVRNWKHEVHAMNIAHWCNHMIGVQTSSKGMELLSQLWTVAHSTLECVECLSITKKNNNNNINSWWWHSCPLLFQNMGPLSDLIALKFAIFHLVCCILIFTRMMSVC